MAQAGGGGGGGPVPGGPDQFTQNSMRAQSLQKGESAKSMDDLIQQILEGPMKWASKFTGINFNSFLNTGFMGGAKLEDAAMVKAGESINKGAQSFTFAGGKLAETANIAGGGGLAALVANAGITAAMIEAATSPISSMKEAMGESMVSMADGTPVSPMPTGGAAPTVSMGLVT